MKLETLATEGCIPEIKGQSYDVKVEQDPLHPLHNPSLSLSKSSHKPKPQPFHRIGCLIHRVSRNTTKADNKFQKLV